MARAKKDTAKPAPAAETTDAADEPAPDPNTPAGWWALHEGDAERLEAFAATRARVHELQARLDALEANAPPAPLADGLWIRMGGRASAEGKAGQLWEVRDGAAETIMPDSDDFRDLMDMRPRLRDAVIEARQRNLG